MLLGLLAWLAPRPAGAVRFTLGVATNLTPLVLEPTATAHDHAVRFGLVPILDFEPIRALAFGVYAPFTILRSGAHDGVASSGAESVFGLSASGRYPILRDTSPEELLLYGTGRFGFGTVDGRAGPFLGAAVGFAATWLETGRGFFGELGVGRLVIARRETVPRVERWFIGITVGLVFRLGGESWDPGRNPALAPEAL